LKLEGGNNYLSTALVEPDGNYSYFATFTNPAHIVQVNHTKGNISYDTSLVLSGTAERYVRCGIMRAGAEHMFFGTWTNPARVVKVHIGESDGNNILKRTGQIKMRRKWGLRYFSTAITDNTGDYAYFATWTRPGRIVAIHLGEFRYAARISTGRTYRHYKTSCVDSTGSFGYFGTWTNPGRVAKIGLAASGSLRWISGMRLRYARFISSSVMGKNDEYVYFGTMNRPGRVMKIRTGDFKYIGYTKGEDNCQQYFMTGNIDPNGDYLFFGTWKNPAMIIQFDTRDFIHVDDIELGTGQGYLMSSVMAVDGDYSYWGTWTRPGYVVSVGL